MQTEKDRILELRKALEYHNYKYYIENAPEISDREFDGLMHDLEKLEEKYPEMYDPNSPTQRVGRNLLRSLINIRCILWEIHIAKKNSGISISGCGK